MSARVAAQRVAVVGAGNGGLAVAGMAALAGCTVRLHDVDERVVGPLAYAGGFEVRGSESGWAAVEAATCDLGEALEGAQIVILVVPGPSQHAAGVALRPYLGPEHVVIVLPGCTGGALEVAATISASERGVLVAEVDAFPYACSKPTPTTSEIAATKAVVHVGCLPAGEAGRAISAISSFLPQTVAAPTVLHTSLSNVNPVLHVPPMVANIGWIESAGASFDFYGDGISPAVAELVAAYDAERVSVAAALDVEVAPLLEWVAEAYGIDEPDVHGAVQALHRRVFGPMKAPPTLVHRYLTEDVPCGSVPTASLGRQLGVPTPVHDSLIQLASLACGEDFWANGRTTETLGIGGLTATEIRAHVGG